MENSIIFKIIFKSFTGCYLRSCWGGLWPQKHSTPHSTPAKANPALEHILTQDARLLLLQSCLTNPFNTRWWRLSRKHPTCWPPPATMSGSSSNRSHKLNKIFECWNMLQYELVILRNEVWKEAIILLVEAWYWGYFFPALISLCSAESWQSFMMSNIAGLGPVECGQGQLHPLTKELHQLTQVIIILTLLDFIAFHNINNQKEKNKHCTSMHGLDQENIFCFSCSWWWESNNELIDAEVSHMCWLHKPGKHSTTDLCWYFQSSIVFRSKNTPDTSVVSRTGK